MPKINTLHTQYEVWEYNPNSKRFGFPHGTYNSIQDAKDWIRDKICTYAYEQLTKQGFKLVIIAQERTLIEL